MKYFISLGNKAADGLWVFLTPNTEMPVEYGMHLTKELSQAQPVESLEVAELVAKATVMQSNFEKVVRIHEWTPERFDQTEVIKVV